MMTNTSKRMAMVVGMVVWAAGGCGGATPVAGEPTGANGDPTVVTPAPSEPKNELGFAKDSTVLAEDGSHVQLASAWMNTNAVIVFLRGHWCIYCRSQLVELEKNQARFERLDTNLIAISSDPADAEKIRAKLGITFTIYSDPDLAAITSFDVLDPANAIARPAAFIVSKSGEIKFRYVGENASDTVLLKVLFAELEKLRTEGR